MRRRCNCLCPVRRRDKFRRACWTNDLQWEGTLDEVTTRAMAHLEGFKIAEALRECKWNKSRAAERLGVSYKTLLHKIKLLGLES